jgi:hypothetical protein
MSEQLARFIVTALAFLAGFCLIKGHYHQKNAVTRVGLVALVAAVAVALVWAHVTHYGLAAWIIVVVALLCGGAAGHLFGVERINSRLKPRAPKRQR